MKIKTEIEAEDNGVTIWDLSGKLQLWIIDGSNFVNDGEITINTSKFNVTRNDDENTIVLKLKES